MIKGLFETHINVSSLEQSMHFYGSVLELELAVVDSTRRVAFYWVGKRGEAMLGLWELKAAKIPQQHFAFRCSPEDIIYRAADYLLNKDLFPYSFFNNGNRQPLVLAWMPAISIYFNDPDNHSLELIGMLPGKPSPELGIISFEEWKKSSSANMVTLTN
jgi:lactoylglutathione lyase